MTCIKTIFQNFDFLFFALKNSWTSPWLTEYYKNVVRMTKSRHISKISVYVLLFSSLTQITPGMECNARADSLKGKSFQERGKLSKA